MKFFILAVLLTTAAYGAVDVENPVCDEFSLGGYLDLRYIQFGGYNAVPSREFAIRRGGIETQASLSSNIQAELKLEFRPDEIFLKDALVGWRPFDSIRGRFGLFRRETLLGGDLSTWDLPLMERPLIYDLREELTYSGRDLGMDVRITLPLSESIELRGSAGVFNGDERGAVRDDNELLYSARGTAGFAPLGIELGASAVAHRRGTADPTEPSGYRSSERLYAFSGDLTVEHNFSNWYDACFYGEFSSGDNWELCDVLAGEDPPKFQGFWGTVTFSYHPWNIQAIRTVSLSMGYDEVTRDTDMEYMERRVSVIGAVYPTENTRIRFGGVRNTVDEVLSTLEYTDLIAEAGFRF